MSIESIKAGLRSGYHHHWKIMAVITALVFIGMVVAFMNAWYAAAVALGLWFLMMIVQWITIDPPDITDEDIHGRGSGSHGTGR